MRRGVAERRGRATKTRKRREATKAMRARETRERNETDSEQRERVRALPPNDDWLADRRDARTGARRQR